MPANWALPGGVRRRRRRRASRWRLVAGLAFAAVLVTGCGAATPSAATSTASVIDGPVDIGGGRHLYLHCAGPLVPGRPTIVLESGYHESSDPWSFTNASAPAVPPAVFERLSRQERVCAYDRPGTLRYADPPTVTDRSSSVPMPRTAGDVVDDLHSLLDAAHVPGPYLLVAHSLGGLFAQLYARRQPSEVAGVVFVDAFATEMPELMGDSWPAYRQVIDRPLPAFANDPSFEVVDIDASVAQVRAAPIFPPIPTAVLTKTEPFTMPAGAPPGLGPTLEKAWPEGAAKIVALAPRSPQTLATGSDHYIQLHDPDLVSQTVELIMVRSGHG
jgi:pimeloyl-ACP methyl ester carboxylesterase